MAGQNHSLLRMFKYLQYLTVLFCYLSLVEAQAKIPEQELIRKLFDGPAYDRRVRPANSDYSGAPVNVKVNMFLRSVSKLDEINNEFNVQLTYRQKWRDERLTWRGDIKYLNLINPENLIWRPDTFFSNEKEGNYHNVMIRNEFVRLFPNGEILHSARISLKLSCQMNFKKFPFDRQTCPIRFASYGYTTSDVQYTWEGDNPVQLMSNLNLHTHNLEGIATVNCDSKTSTGNYSCLRADVTIKRLFSPYLIYVYIPCMMMFIVSCLSFWIDYRETTARMILVVLTLLVLAIQTAEINKTFPATGYTKAIDVYTGMCLTFVFGALIEFIVVQYIARSEEDKRDSRLSSKCDINMGADDSAIKQHGAGDEEQEIPLKDPTTNNDDKAQKPQGVETLLRFKERAVDASQKYVARFDSLPEKIDGVSRVAFPAAFLLFMILYWPVYSLSS